MARGEGLEGEFGADAVVVGWVESGIVGVVLVGDEFTVFDGQGVAGIEDVIEGAGLEIFLDKGCGEGAIGFCAVCGLEG